MRWAAALGVLGACSTAPEGPAAEDSSSEPAFVPLDDAHLARRISLDLRGVAPTLAELDRAEAGGLGALVDEWMVDPQFEAHLVDVFAESWNLRADSLRVTPEELGVLQADEGFMVRAFEDEPAHLLAHLVATDAPWSEVVTTDRTMANATLVELAPVAWIDPADPAEWHEATYTDPRPALGVLSTSGLWLRYSTTLFNYNRGRAAALAGELLCVDFLARPVGFTALEDGSSDGLAEAARSQSGCIACHASLDPLAASLFGFWPFEDKDAQELITYHPEREPLGTAYLGVAPAWFGTPVEGVARLGPLIAADPRLASCAVRRTAGWLWQREPGGDDLAKLAELQGGASAGELHVLDVIRALLADPEYRAGGMGSGATDAQTTGVATLRSMSAPMLASFVAELTGFRWTWGSWNELDSDVTGFRLLAGGVDGSARRDPQPDPTVSRALVVKRLAEAGADTVVTHDTTAAPAERRLLPDGAESLTPEDPGLAEALAAVIRRIDSAPPDAESLATLTTLYGAAYAESDGPGAWRTVIAAALRAPEAWTY